jgi:hypothetical protein
MQNDFPEYHTPFGYVQLGPELLVEEPVIWAAVDKAERAGIPLSDIQDAITVYRVVAVTALVMGDFSMVKKLATKAKRARRRT